MTNLRAFSTDTKVFPLELVPVDYQLTKHFINLFLTYSPSHVDQFLSVRFINMDQLPYLATTRQILNIFEAQINYPLLITAHLKSNDPIKFRCAQLIQHYSSKKIANWIELFYGRKI